MSQSNCISQNTLQMRSEETPEYRCSWPKNAYWDFWDSRQIISGDSMHELCRRFKLDNSFSDIMKNCDAIRPDGVSVIYLNLINRMKMGPITCCFTESTSKITRSDQQCSGLLGLVLPQAFSLPAWCLSKFAFRKGQ